jgi:hypothetical protein
MVELMGGAGAVRMNADAGDHCARHLAEWKSFVCGFVAARLFLAGVSHIS